MSTIEIQPSPVVLPAISEDGVICRRVATLEEYQECATLQDEIWGPGFRELVPPAVLMVAQKMGGVCAAAFSPAGRMLGFVFGITGVRDGVVSHWSDMLAVRQEARGAHIGERLKRHQRDLCLAVGVRTMYWTFDPLVARNAHLNLMRLGARASEYVVNMYGTNTGSPLHGSLETDRWIAAWDLTGDAQRAPVVHREGVFVVRPNADGTAPVALPLSESSVVRIAVPVDHEQLDMSQRAHWRAATRRALMHYLETGYQVSAFQRASGDQPPFYQLERL
jgi:predicted GNAT superfamily acetyltransferase